MSHFRVRKLSLVSVDFLGDSHGAVVDGLSTRVMNKTMVKVLAWYDNESGFTHQFLRLLRRVAAERLRTFHDETMEVVRGLTAKQWRRICSEDWSVGVTARHIAAGHYDIKEFIRMIIVDKGLPEFTEEEVRQAVNEHAEKHAVCTREEVLDLLLKKGKALIVFVAGLPDADLDHTAYLSPTGQKISAEAFISEVVLHSAREHLESIKEAVKD